MALYRKLYAGRGAELAAEAGWWLIFPSYWLLNALLALYLETTLEAARRVEEKPCYERAFLLAAGTPVLVALLLLSAPLAVVGSCLWLPAQPFRRPYRYSENVPLVVVSRSQTADGGPTDGDGSCLAAGDCDGDRLGFAADCPTVSLLSCNVCLLPDGIARFNNLGHTMDRAGKIANLLVDAEMRRREKCDGGTATERQQVTFRIRSDVPSGVDVLCLQEVFDKRAAAKMRSILSQRFPYILSDVDAFCCGKLLNSGLLFASKFKILDADYLPFIHSAKEDALAAKGLLMVKVLLDAAATSRSVGYVFCSHLQAHRDQSLVRQAQLDQVESWIAQFKERCTQPGDALAFDMLCGDFNMDHTSDEHKHPLFDDYADSCCCRCDHHRAAHKLESQPVDDSGSCNGAACSSTVGTELIQHRMYDEEICSPIELMRVLLDDAKRPEYIESCCQAGGGRRRIDYVFLRRPACETGAQWVEVQEHAFLTAMVTLTDHLPVYTRVSVNRGSHQHELQA